MDRIIKSINAIFNINKSSLEKLTSCLRPIKIPKKTILIEPNKKNDNIYFIEEGIVRSYSLIDGKEITSWFSKEGELTYSTNYKRQNDL